LDVPREPVNYIHRAGRAARAGRFGRSVAFVTEREIELVKSIEAMTKIRMEPLWEASREIEWDDQVALVLHKATRCKREAEMDLRDSGFFERLEHRRDSTKTKRGTKDDV